MKERIATPSSFLRQLGRTLQQRGEAVLGSVNRFGERAIEKGWIEVTPSNHLGTIVRVIEAGNQIRIDISRERSFGTNRVSGVLVRMTDTSFRGVQEDIFSLSLFEETGGKFRHVQRTPWFGEVLQTADESLQPLMPYKDEVLQVAQADRKVYQILQRGFNPLPQAA